MIFSRRSFLDLAWRIVLFPLALQTGFASELFHRKRLVIGMGSIGEQICGRMNQINQGTSKMIVRSNREHINIPDLTEVILISGLDDEYLNYTVEAIEHSNPESTCAIVTYPYVCEGAKRLRLADQNLERIKDLKAEVHIVHSDLRNYSDFAIKEGSIPLAVAERGDAEIVLRQVLARLL